MWQAQERCSKRRKRRKEERPERFYLGRAVKSCTTVIDYDGALSGSEIDCIMELTLRGRLFSMYARKQSQKMTRAGKLSQKGEYYGYF